MKRKLAFVGLAFTLFVMPVTRLTVRAQSGAAAQTTKQRPKAELLTPLTFPAEAGIPCPENRF